MYGIKMENPTTAERPHILTYNEIKQASDRIVDSTIHTPLCEAKISKYLDYELYFKCENLQYTGSCAERGVRNAFSAASPDFYRRGVIVPSNGNLALGAAYHGKNLNIPVTVVLPGTVPPAQAQRISELGTDVILYGETIEDAQKYSKKLQEETKQAILCGDDPVVMAGLGTVGLEILTQLPETDAVIVPVSSGGLLASVLVAAKKLKCSCLVYGAESARVPKMMAALQAGEPVQVPVSPGLAEGLNASIVGKNAFATLQGRLDRMLVVDDTYIARTMVSMLERERLVVDGAGVVALAAVVQGLVPELQGKRTVCILSSGNIESGKLARCIQRGLGATNRLLRFAVALPDQRNSLEQLGKVVADENVVVKSIFTEPMCLKNNICNTWASVIVEAANDEHASNFKNKLRHMYPAARFASVQMEELQHKAPT